MAVRLFEGNTGDERAAVLFSACTACALLLGEVRAVVGIEKSGTGGALSLRGMCVRRAAAMTACLSATAASPRAAVALHLRGKACEGAWYDVLAGGESVWRVLAKCDVFRPELEANAIILGPAKVPDAGEEGEERD